MTDPKSYKDKAKPASRLKPRELLVRVRDRFKTMFDADQENREAAMEDMKFVNIPGHQWDLNMKQERGSRPCYEFNKLRVSSKRIINNIRANRPQGKVRAVEGGDKEVADINEGLIRNIWNISDADTIVDYAAEYQVNGGMGAWRVETEYASDSTFDQDIFVRPIKNPFCVYVDPACQDLMKRDAEDWIVTERISKVAFTRKYPKKSISEFDDLTEFDNDEDWGDDETVRIVEYWWKEPRDKEIWQLVTGEVVDSESDEAAGIPEQAIERRRMVKSHDIMMCIASGDAILEGPVKWAGTQFPFVMIYGEHLVIDGKTYWWGNTRFAKDAQRSYNVSRTAITETIAQAPQAKWWSTPEQAKGHTNAWAEAHKKNFPYLLYNADAKAPGPPMRMGGADVPVALIQESQLASDEIKAVTGIFDASLGNQSNEKSGRAILARQQQGEISTFNFQDNLAKGIQRTYEILLDLIPNVYDTERELRVIGSDGAEDYKRVNQVVINPETGTPVRVHDITSGKYDTTITIGPNFSTQRQEAAETYGQLGQQFPEMWSVAGDLIFKSMDLPYSEDIAERLQALLPPQIQQQLNQEGGEVPPEVQQAMQQAAQAMEQVQQQTELINQAAAEVEQEKAESDKAKAEVREAMAKLGEQQAKFEAQVAKQMADLTVKQSQVDAAAGQVDQNTAVAQNIELLVQRYAEAANEILAGAMDSITSADPETKAEVTSQPIININGNRVSQITAKRNKDGTLVAVPEYENAE